MEPPGDVPPVAPFAMALGAATKYGSKYLAFPAIDNENLLAHFDVPAINNPPGLITPAALLEERCTSSEEVPTAFLQLIRSGPDDATGTIQCIHRLSKMQNIPGLPNSAGQWNGQYFGFVGDVIVGQMPNIVTVTSARFALAQGIFRAPTHELVTTTLAAAPDVVNLGPYGDADAAAAELVRCRRCIALPPSLIHLFLGDPCGPVVTYNRVYEKLTEEGKLVESEVLLKFLHVAMTLPAPGEISPLAMEPFSVPLADQVLKMHRHLKLLQDLPALSPNQNGDGNHALVNVLTNIDAGMRAGRAERAEEKALETVKSLPTMVGFAMVNFLMNVMGKGDEYQEGDLPSFWSEFSAAKKGIKMSVLRSKVQEAAMDIKPNHTVIVPASLVQLLGGMDCPLATMTSKLALPPFWVSLVNIKIGRELGRSIWNTR